MLIYTNHWNLEFSKGIIVNELNKLFTLTENLIRHTDINEPIDYIDPKVKALIKEAIDLEIKDMVKLRKSIGRTIAKIKKK